MPNFNYTGGLPNPPNLPAQDVEDMQINCNSVESWAQQDHFGFNDDNGGWHQNVRLQNHAAPGNPAFSGDPGGVLYSNNPVASANNPGWPFWQNNLGTFQITGSASANIPSAIANGWSFLPGGVIMQWGNVALPPNTAPVVFPIPFPTNCFIVTGSLGNNVIGIPAINATLTVYSVAAGGFSYAVINNVANIYTNFSWVAIGN